MACKQSGILLCLGLFLIARSFCQCTSLTKLKALDKLSQVKGGELHHGKLLIGHNSLQGAKLKGTKAAKNLLDVDTDYQADMAWGQPKQPKEKGYGPTADNAAVAGLLKMEPKVECTGDSMKLQVKDAASIPGSLFFVDRGSLLSPLPLSKLPPSCGYTIKSTRRELVLVAPYDGCFVALEEDSYILPLLWLGLPMRMSCPSMRQSTTNPPMVTCHAEGMVIKIEGTLSVNRIKVNLNDNWEPLMKASSRCAFSVVVHPDGVVISVRYAPCLEKKSEMYTLELAGDGETKISCPPLSPAQLEPNRSPGNGQKTQTKTPSKAVYPSTPPHDSASTNVPVPTPENPPQPPTIQQPNGQEKPLYPYLFYVTYPPMPENPFFNTEKPLPEDTVQTKQPVSKEPKVEIHQPQYPYPFLPQGPYQMPVPPLLQIPTPGPSYLQPEPEYPPATKPTIVPEAPQGQVYQPLYPNPFYNPFYPQPEPENPSATKPTASPKPPQPEAPQGQVHQPLHPNPFYNPFYPQPEPEIQPAMKPTASPKPPQPEAPQGQVYQLIYPQPEPEIQPATKPTASAKPPQPEAPQGQVYQLIQPEPEIQPATKPTIIPKPLQPEAPKGEVYQPLYPIHFYNPFYPQPSPENSPATKPTIVPKPPQPEAPQGQVYQPLYPKPSYPQPEPEIKPATKPTASPKPPQPEAPQGQVYQLIYPQPEPEIQPATKPTASPKPPQPEPLQSQVYQPLYPKPFYNPFYPQPEPENPPATKPTIVPRPPHLEAPQGQVHQPLYPNPFYNPFYPQPEPENPPATKPTASPKPPQPEAPQGQVYQPIQPEPGIQPATKPTIAPKPLQPETPQGQVYQPIYPQPEPKNPPVTKPTVAPKPEVLQGQVYQPIYPNPLYYNTFYPLSVPEKPTAVPKLPAMETAMGQVHKPSYPQPFRIPGTGDNNPNKKPVQIEQPPAVKPSPQPPAIYTQQPQQVTTPNPVYCPEFCKFGFSHCCPQFAFHQHLHHIVPAEPGSKGAPSLYAPLPFFPSAFSGFGNGFGSAPLPQKPTEAATTQATTASTSAPVSTQSPQLGDQIKQSYFQPLDGNPSTLPTGNPSKFMNSKANPYFVPNSLYSNWQNLQNLLHRQSPAHSSMLSKLQVSSNEPINPLSAGDIINQKPSESKGPSQPIVHSKYDHDLVPYYMLQDDQAPTSKSEVPNNSSQPFVSGSKKSERQEQSYVLLQHGPPGREPNSFIESPRSFRDKVYDANFLAQHAARHHRSKAKHPQNLSPPQEKPQPINWLQKGMSSALPGNVNYMARQLHIPGKEFQQWRSASHHQTNGLNQLIQRPGGKQELPSGVAFNVK